MGHNQEKGLIKENLQRLVHDCRAQLEQDEVPILMIDHESMIAEEDHHSTLFELGATFDPCWQGFPDIGLS